MSPQQKRLQFKKYAHRKLMRPIATGARGFNHLVLKARRPVLRLNYLLIQSVLIETQRRFGIELRAFSVMPDHIHLTVRVSSRKQWADALRFFSGQVALKLKLGKLWAQRAWSRVVKAGRDYRGLVRYISRNPFKAGIADLRIDSLWILNGILFGALKPGPEESLQRSSPHHGSSQRSSPRRNPLALEVVSESGAMKQLVFAF